MKRLPCILLLLHQCSAIFLEDARWSEERITADSLCAHSEEELSEEGLDRYFEHTVYPRRARFISSSVSSERNHSKCLFRSDKKAFQARNVIWQNNLLGFAIPRTSSDGHLHESSLRSARQKEADSQCWDCCALTRVDLKLIFGYYASMSKAFWIIGPCP